MSSHPLDRAVWSALTGRQAHLAIVGDGARRFVPDVSPFGAIAAEGDTAIAGLVRDHGSIIFLQPEDVAPPAGTRVELSAAGVQMVGERVTPPDTSEGIIRLTAADVPDMIALTALTEPGPFLPRTHILGEYYGIREGGRLIAMAGERLKPAGFTEVSGVCTHPDARGRGLAATLSRLVASRIAARGETAFLHTYASNQGAISLYERLGFRMRREVRITFLAQA